MQVCLPFFNSGSLKNTEIAIPGITTNGSTAAPAADNCGSCKNEENSKTAKIKPIIEVPARKPLNKLNGKLAFTTPAKLTKPTVKYIISEVCAASNPRYGAAKKQGCAAQKNCNTVWQCRFEGTIKKTVVNLFIIFLK